MPSSVIGALRVALSLDSGQFETGLKKSQKSVDGFALSVSKGLLGGIGAAAGGFLTFNTVLNGVNKALTQFGDIADKAAAAGLDPEFFQGISHGASLAGINMETLSGALNTFNKNVGLASEGKGKLVGQLELLNPELLKNIELSTDQAQRIKAVADAIHQETDASRQAAIATAAFGSEGVRLAAILKDGGKAIDDMVAKAKSIGIVVDRSLIEKADELGDKLDTAGKIVETKLNVGFLALAPLVADATGKVADFAVMVGIAYDRFRDLAERTDLGRLQVELKRTYLEMEPIKDSIAEIEAALAGGGPNGMILKLDLAEANAKLQETEERALKLLNRVQELQGYGAPPAKSDATIDPNAGMLGRGGPGRNTPAEPFYEPGGGSSSTGSGLAAMDGLAARVESLRQSLMTEQQLELDSHATRLAEIQSFYDQGAIAKGEYDTLIEAAEGQHGDRMAQMVQDQVDEEQRIRDLAASGVASTFGALASLAETFGEKGLATAKAFGVAQVGISTAQGIMQALTLPPPASWGQAAATSATTAVQLSVVVAR